MNFKDLELYLKNKYTINLSLSEKEVIKNIKHPLERARLQKNRVMFI